MMLKIAKKLRTTTATTKTTFYLRKQKQFTMYMAKLHRR